MDKAHINDNYKHLLVFMYSLALLKIDLRSSISDVLLLVVPLLEEREGLPEGLEGLEDAAELARRLI